jgi:hypothetical protein
MSRRKRVRRVLVLAAVALGVAAPAAQARPTGAPTGGYDGPPVAESGGTSGATGPGSSGGYTWVEAGIGAGAVLGVAGVAVVASGPRRPRRALQS